MNALKTFIYNESAVRTVQLGGEPWFVLKDVCDVLGLSNSRVVAERLDEDEKGVSIVDTLGGKQDLTVINESGLYSVVLLSRKPEAKKFKKWITSEVLPSIRKHGAYMTPETIEAAILNPDYLIQLATALKEEQTKRMVLEAKNTELAVANQTMRPKADYFDELVDLNLLTSIRVTAKELGVGERAFVAFLLERRFLFRNKIGRLLPYNHNNDGLFEVKEGYNDHSGWVGVQTLITPKGRETFRLLLDGM